MNIIPVKFSKLQYHLDSLKKTQIYLHHTAGGKIAKNVIAGWEKTPEKVGVCCVISYDGEIVQPFSSNFWAYHLGLKEKHFTKYNLPFINIDRCSIGVELCNWGQLTEKNGKFYNYINNEIPLEEVYELDTPFRGFKYYHNYSDEQLNSLQELLIFWGKEYKIPLAYNEDIWNITPRAYKLDPGVFTHCSVRPDKNDVYPHHKLIEMLKSL